jgi:hypothetical protein
VANQLVRPLDEILHVGRIRMSTVVLTPREMSAQDAIIHGWHFCRPVVFLDA